MFKLNIKNWTQGISAVLLLSSSQILFAEDILEGYKRANQHLPSNFKIYNANITPHFIEGGSKFWYQHFSAKGSQYVLIDPRKKKRTALFDHKKIARALSNVTSRKINVNALPFNDLELLNKGHTLRVTIDGITYDCQLKKIKCSQPDVKNGMPGEVISPDKKWAAYVLDHNLHVRSVKTGKTRALTTDGEPHNGYGITTESQLNTISAKFNRPVWGDSHRKARLLWSPDSKRILSYKMDERKVPELPFIDSLPDGVYGSKPKLHTARVAFPADEFTATSKLVIFEVENGKRTDVQYKAFYTHYDLIAFQYLGWGKQSDRVYFVHDERGSRHAKQFSADVKTGKVTKVITERSKTYFWLPLQPPSDFITSDDKEFFWISNRSGWKHIYHYDMKTDALLNPVTTGDWNVENVHHIDEKGRWIYFYGNGRDEGLDPYYQQLYRAHFDGSSLERLTPENAQHSVTVSPNGRYFIDRYSTVDTPPVTILRRTDGKMIRTLETADISELDKIGWQKPERFHVKARDGKTDIYGVMWRPSHFDPKKKYPILDSIYGGPQSIYTPRSFSPVQPMTELGFIVVRIDGMGTPGRSRAFQEVSYNTGFKEAGGLVDHITGIKQLAARYSFIDIDRVGIFGHSGGGYASARAMIDHPDFFKVAVASAGSHDQRLYQLEWGEKFIGAYEWKDSDYIAQANSYDVSRLKGKLFLAHGEMDDDVPPANTMQLVGALIKANKDFDLVLFPRLNHTSLARDPYFKRRRWDYFVKHLQGVTPPKNYKITLPY